MIEDPRISRALRYLTYTVLAGLVIFGVYALLNRPPDLSNLSDADIEATVVAEVADRLEGTPTRAVTPDVTASIEARLTQVALGTPLPTAAASATATPAPSPVPVPVEDSPGGVIGFVTGLLTGIWGLITGLWGIIQVSGTSSPSVARCFSRFVASSCRSSSSSHCSAKAPCSRDLSRC